MKLSASASGFVLAAAITVIFNTVLAIVKDSYKPLNTFMTSLSGHQWTTHGLADLILFLALGLIFTNTRVAERMDPGRLTGILLGSVAVASLGLVGWYLLF